MLIIKGGTMKYPVYAYLFLCLFLGNMHYLNAAESFMARLCAEIRFRHKSQKAAEPPSALKMCVGIKPGAYLTSNKFGDLVQVQLCAAGSSVIATHKILIFPKPEKIIVYRDDSLQINEKTVLTPNQIAHYGAALDQLGDLEDFKQKA